MDGSMLRQFLPVASNSRCNAPGLSSMVSALSNKLPLNQPMLTKPNSPPLVI